MYHIRIFLQYFIWEFASWFFLLSQMIQCHILRNFNPVLLSKWWNSLIFKMICFNFFINEEKCRQKNRTYKHSWFTVENTTQDQHLMFLLLHRPSYNLEELQKDLFQTYQIIQNKILAPDTWKFSIPARVIVQQVLVVYLSYFLWNGIYHNITHAISEKSVCSNRCLLKLYVCIAFRYVTICFWLNINFSYLIKVS